MDQRKQLVEAYMAGEENMAELCRRFGVSRKTAYKWVDRYLGGCELEDRSRRPHRSPNAVPAWVEDSIVAARKSKPRWGPKKLRTVLARANPGVELPSLSTFALIFKRNGLVVPRRRRRRTPPSRGPLAHATKPNALWCIDFKGDFPVGRTRCYPLTITDAYSRYLLACVALTNTSAPGVLRALRTVFDQFGLPDAIRSDNGSPFASKAPCGLSELSCWWLKLGIRHERIEPGKPQQNARHERMHLTLKLDTAMPPCSSLRIQQRAFDRFRAEYNEQRPHEALGLRVPAEFYERSVRRLPDPHWGHDFRYPEHFETLRVNKTGTICWNRSTVLVSTVLRHELLGLDWNTTGNWDVFFGTLHLGTLRRRRGRLQFLRIDDARP
jgi:putative transposase